MFGVSVAERSSGILSGDLLDEGQRDLSLGVLETPLTTEIRVCWGHMDHAHFDIVVVLGRMGGVLGILVVVVAVFWWVGDVQKTYGILSIHHGSLQNKMSHEKNPGWLGYIRDYTTQLYRAREHRAPAKDPAPSHPAYKHTQTYIQAYIQNKADTYLQAYSQAYPKAYT